jgi:phosphoenolpyruvate-protein phosphotransferase
VTVAAVLAFGSPTSHAAILARAKGIPLLVAAGADVLAVADGTTLVVDADSATLIVDPTSDIRADYEHRLTKRAHALAVAHAAAAEPAVTADGTTIAVCANVGSVDDAKAAADAHADGAGLVRTEFLFQSRREPPTVEEQEAVYRAITDAFGGRRVVFRTLDAGADKPLPFLPAEHEANPYLGVRGLRLALRHPDLLGQQLQAICAVAADAPVSVMFPMVSSIDELRAALGMLDDACGGTRPDGLHVGTMIEVPSAALKAAVFAPHVDFFSIGTNDLTQYALAAERGNPALAELADPLDPGVLQLIRSVCRNAGPASVSICGEAAADPVATPVFVGLGVDSLSVAGPSVATVKAAVRRVDRGQAADLAVRVLCCGTAAEVRRLVEAT